MHSVSIGTALVFMNILIDKFTEAAFSYSKPYYVFELKNLNQYFAVLFLFCVFLFLFFALLGTTSPLKTLYMSLHTTRLNL